MVQVNEKIVMCGFGSELPTMMSIAMKSRAMASAHKVTLDPLLSIATLLLSTRSRLRIAQNYLFILAQEFLDLGPT